MSDTAEFGKNEYRVMRDSAGALGIFDFYYGGTAGEGWSDSPISPYGETLDDLRVDLQNMMMALNKPVLDFETGKPWQGDDHA